MNKIHITDLFDIEHKYLYKLDDDILLNYKFAVKLDAHNNHKINHINHMTKLKVLDASGFYGI